MVSNQTSTNISSLLPKIKKAKKNIFPDNIQERSLVYIINIYACGPLLTVRPNLSTHAKKEMGFTVTAAGARPRRSRDVCHPVQVTLSKRYVLTFVSSTIHDKQAHWLSVTSQTCFCERLLPTSQGRVPSQHQKGRPGSHIQSSQARLLEQSHLSPEQG